MSAQRTAVIRLGSLGEVVQAGAVTAGLAPVVFVTRPAWVELAASLPGVVAVRAAERGLDLSDCDALVDLQGSLRARWLGRTARGPRRGLDRADLRRRLRVGWKAAPPAPLILRFAAAAGRSPAPVPWMIPPALAEPPEGWGLIPGAAWANKRWPAARWAALAARLPGPITLFGGPEDGPLLSWIAARTPTPPRLIAERGFAATLPALAGCAGLIGGDTGLSHLGRALGVPTLVLLGPTTPEDGHWAEHPHTIGRPLPCRPCGRYGGRGCPVGDHACMHEVDVEQVIHSARSMVSA